MLLLLPAQDLRNDGLRLVGGQGRAVREERAVRRVRRAPRGPSRGLRCWLADSTI